MAFVITADGIELHYDEYGAGDRVILSAQAGGIGRVYCPLSYGGPRKYVNRVAAFGKEALGDAFVPLTDYIPFDEYRRIWDSVNVAVFNQRRQEALGNIYSLLMMKKTVYLRPGTATSAFMHAPCSVSRSNASFGTMT